MTAGRIAHAAIRDAEQAITNRLVRSIALTIAVTFVGVVLPSAAMSDVAQARPYSATCREGIDAINKDVGEAAARGRKITEGEMKDFWPRADEFFNACIKLLNLAPTDAAVNARMAAFMLMLTVGSDPEMKLAHEAGIQDAFRAAKYARETNDVSDLAWACNLLNRFAVGSEYRSPVAERIEANRRAFAISGQSSRNDDAARDEEMQQQQQQQAEQRNEDAQRAQRGY